MLDRKRQELDHRDHIYDVVDERNEHDGIIDSVTQVKQLAEERINQASDIDSFLILQPMVELKPSLIRNVLKVDLGMRYRKIHDVAVFSNGEKNLILR